MLEVGWWGGSLGNLKEQFILRVKSADFNMILMILTSVVLSINLYIFPHLLPETINIF